LNDISTKAIQVGVERVRHPQTPVKLQTSDGITAISSVTDEQTRPAASRVPFFWLA
jgi:hypothetical protein